MNKLLILLIKAYKLFVSPLFRFLFGEACRYQPNCSEFTIEALEKYGTIEGLRLGFHRISRCHPLGGSGYDPVPELNNR